MKVEIIPSTRDILADGLIAVSYEMNRLKVKSQSTDGLTPQEIKGLTDLTKAFKELSSEQANLRKQDLIAQMSDEELKHLLQKVIESNPSLLLTGE